MKIVEESCVVYMMKVILISKKLPWGGGYLDNNLFLIGLKIRSCFNHLIKKVVFIVGTTFLRCVYYLKKRYIILLINVNQMIKKYGTPIMNYKVGEEL